MKMKNPPVFSGGFCFRNGFAAYVIPKKQRYSFYQFLEVFYPRKMGRKCRRILRNSRVECQSPSRVKYGS
jgi:hypothetical protein